MAISEHERERMLAVRLRGPRVIARLEAIGITKLNELADRDPHQLVHQVDIAAGRPIWHPPIATQAMTNLIAAARNADPRSCGDPLIGQPTRPAVETRSNPLSTRPAGLSGRN